MYAVFPRNFSFLAALALSMALAACGGGSGGGSSSSGSSSSSSSSGGDGLTITPDFELHSLAGFPIGIAVSAAGENNSITQAADASARQAVITEHFSQVTAGNIMKMSYLHPEEGTFTYTNADELVNFAQTNGLTVHGHTLVWHSDYQVPDFMKSYTGDFAAMLQDHVTQIVDHFAAGDVVVSWDVVNEAIDTSQADGWRHSLFYDALPPATEGDIPEYIRVAFSAARAADANAELYYNDYDHTANAARLAKTLEIADALQADDLIDGIGFQMHIYMGYPSLTDFQNAFQQVVDRGLKVKISELDIPIFDPYTGTQQVDALTADLAAQQRVRYCQVVATYLDTVPVDQRGGITVWGLTDDESWLINQYAGSFGEQKQVWPLLFHADLSAKPALQGFADALTGTPCE